MFKFNIQTMKRKPIQSYEELINTHYGHFDSKKIKELFSPDEVISNYYGKPEMKKEFSGQGQAAPVLAKSFDDGELLSQVSSRKSFDEYVVQSSITDLEFEEYVVQKTDEVSGQSSLPARIQSRPSGIINVGEEYNMNLLDPLSREQPADVKNLSHDASFDYSNSQKEAVKFHQGDATKPSEEDFIADMQSILTGQKVFDPISRKTIEKEKLGQQQSAANSNTGQQPAPEFKNEHAIFDRIRQNMEYANAYDVGTVELEKRFSDFDRMEDIRDKSGNKARATKQVVSTVESLEIP